MIRGQDGVEVGKQKESRRDCLFLIEPEAEGYSG